MSYGSSSIGSTPYGAVPQATGVTIIPEVAFLTRELVLAIEIDLIQPKTASEEES